MTPVFPSTMDVTVRVMSIALRHRKSSTARDVDPKPSWSGGDERLGLGVKWEHQQNVGTLMILCKKFVRKAVLITSRRYGGKMGSIASDPKKPTTDLCKRRTRRSLPWRAVHRPKTLRLSKLSRKTRATRFRLDVTHVVENTNHAST